MNKLFFLLLFLIMSSTTFGQNDFYIKKWKEAEKALQEQKNKDAETIITQIAAQAKKEDNKGQYIKALAYLRLAVSERDEKEGVNHIQEFEKEIQGLAFPEKNIVHSMLATLYNSYYDNHRYKIYKRTELTNPSDLKYPADIETWTPQLFFDKIHEHYEASLSNAQALATYQVSQYPELFTAPTNADNLRSTVFDVLVHRAIDFYQSNETDITKAAYFFKLNNPNAFADAKTFANTIFENKDDYSTKFLALSYLQLATRYHLTDAKPDALIDLECKRLQFSRNQYDAKEKDSLYVQGLEKLISLYPEAEATAHTMRLLAQEISKKEPFRALLLVNSIMEKFPESMDLREALVLKDQILSKQLTLTTERSYVPNTNILGLLSYQNLETVYFKIIKLTYADFNARELDYSRNQDIPKGKSIRSWELGVTNHLWGKDEKYQSHATDIIIEPLPLGCYAIIASGDADFDITKAPVSFSLFQSSNISYVYGKETDKSSIYVLDRATGEGIPHAQVNRYEYTYDYNKRENTLNKVDTKVADLQGEAQYLNEKDGYNQYHIEIVLPNESYWSQNAMYGSGYRGSKETETLYMFTDRAIYRPGQTIYFKGILFSSSANGKEHQVLSNKKIEIVLKDANYQDVKKISLTTNNFGSIHGSFQAPDGLLNGSFTIYSEKGSKQIRVEEYKRPKFEVVLDSLEKNVKLNDVINVTGHAKAYAGNSIDGAKVSYTVTRKVRWPYYWCFYYWGRGGYQQGANDIQLTRGDVVTDADGKFTISFKALGDELIDERTKPFYDFEINADVTDLNGETRTGNKSYTITNQSLMLAIEVDEDVMDFNKFNALKLSSTNIEGKFTKTDVELSLIKLKEPNRFLKKRLWATPENNQMSQVEFKKYFPDFEYDKESDPLFWENEKTIWTKTITTDENGSVYLQKIAPLDGNYLLTARAKDPSGLWVEEKKVIRLVNVAEKRALNNEALFTFLTAQKLQPKDKTSVSCASAYKDARIHSSIYRQNVFEDAWYKNRNDFTITEADRGGFYISYFMVYDNRYYDKTIFVDVPWTNKELDISYETFRDKIAPGSEQTWKIKISGKQKDKVGAEVLTTMYDASLDAFAKNNWFTQSLYRNNTHPGDWNSNAFRVATQKTFYNYHPTYPSAKYRFYPRLNMFGLESGRGYYVVESLMRSDRVFSPPRSNDALPRLMKMKLNVFEDGNSGDGENNVQAGMVNQQQIVADSAKPEEKIVDESKVQLRTNMNETAFFFPDLKTDDEGNILFSFTAPDALTRWNVKSIAHTKDMRWASLDKSVVTQKELMLVPNHPRFMREGDKMMYSTKLTNLSDKDLEGQVYITLLNAQTEQPINAKFGLKESKQFFQLAAGKSTEIVWELLIPQAYTEPVLVKIIAKAGNFSDGEQVSIPLLLNSVLVTETLPLPVRANTTKNFTFDKLLASGSSNTLQHHNLTLEYTSNPAWYAVQALPYLTEYPYDCAEQSFNRYYANALASHIANSSPKIQEIFSQWKETDTAALLSNLEKNKDLKNALLQETPWVMDAKNETEQKKKIANLFNMVRMSKELAATLKTLVELQSPNGGFSWFKGMRDNPFITQYIVTGIARLQNLGVSDAVSNDKIQTILKKAIPYLDARLYEDYQRLVANKQLKNNNLGYHQIQYLYLRSFFLDRKMNANTKVAFEYYKNLGTKHWTSYNKYMQGMLALALHRYDEKATAQNIIESLRQNAIHKEEMGMYWKELNRSYWWYEAPIEAHALLIEAFKEVGQNENEVNELKVWLLKQKQTQQWKTTKATADACYALLLDGADWLAAEPVVEISLGNQQLNLKDYKQEAGTGYTKIIYPGQDVIPEMGNIKVKVTSDKNVGTTWGAVYWQYFEQLDKITDAETPLSLKKQVYKVVQTDRGESLELVKDNAPLHVGDKVKIRIELRVDRPMEFVHMKDMRGACFEPTNVLSNYKYQNGLGYYESTKDASTQFFFDYLNPGTYVFEYPMFATMKGNYSNGITTIQCMYAPEFSSHSEGVRVSVE